MKLFPRINYSVQYNTPAAKFTVNTPTVRKFSTSTSLNYPFLLAHPTSAISSVFLVTTLSLISGMLYGVLSITHSNILTADRLSDIKTLSETFLPQINHYCNTYLKLDGSTIGLIDEPCKYLGQVSMAGWRIMVMQLADNQYICNSAIGYLKKAEGCDPQLLVMWEESRDLISHLISHLCKLHNITEEQDIKDLAQISENMAYNIHCIDPILAKYQNNIIK